MEQKCYNQLELISKDKHEILRFYNDNFCNTKQVLSFDKLIPVAKNIDGSINYFDSSEKWGTKYDAFDFTNVQKRDNTLIYCFHTNISPPTTWLCNVTANYPSICFKLEYKQWNSEYWGYQAYENGFKTLEEVIHSENSKSPQKYQKLTTCAIQ